MALNLLWSLSELAFILMDMLPDRDLISLSRTGCQLRELVTSYHTVRLGFIRRLGAIVGADSVKMFRELCLLNEAIIKGPFVQSCLRFGSGVGKIMVLCLEPSKLPPFREFFQTQGFEHHAIALDADGQVNSIEVFWKPLEDVSVLLLGVLPPVIAFVLREGAHDTEFIAYERLYIPYPSLTLCRIEGTDLHLRWPFVLAGHVPEEPTQPFFSFERPGEPRRDVLMRVRHLGDSMTYVLPLTSVGNDGDIDEELTGHSWENVLDVGGEVFSDLWSPGLVFETLKRSDLARKYIISPLVLAEMVPALMHDSMPGTDYDFCQRIGTMVEWLNHGGLVELQQMEEEDGDKNAT